MTDKERIRTRLLDLEKYSERIKKVVPDALAGYKKMDFVVKNAVERNLQLISDMEIDVLVLLYKGLELSLASDDVSVIDRFSSRMSERLLAKIRERRVLRNLLIHAYSEKSYDDEVFKQASNLGDIEEFIKEANKLLGKLA